MRKKIILLLLHLFILNLACDSSLKNVRPVQMQFIVNSQIVSYTVMEYNDRGDIVRLTEYENGAIKRYNEYSYDIYGVLSQQKVYDGAYRLLETTKFIYDSSGDLKEERDYSPDNRLVEYSVYLYKNNRIVRIEIFNPDKKMNRFNEFSYSSKRLESILFDYVREYTMRANCIYDENSLLTGYTVDHSSFRGKGTAVVKFIYEDGPVTEQAWRLLIR